MKIESAPQPITDEEAAKEWKKLVKIIKAAHLAIQAEPKDVRDELEYNRLQSEQEAAAIIAFDTTDRTRY